MQCGQDDSCRGYIVCDASCAAKRWCHQCADLFVLGADWLQKYHTTHGGDVDARKAQYADMVNKYYDLATSFYEYGEPTASKAAADAAQ